MPLSARTCPYCGHPELISEVLPGARHALSCPQCGARGPVAPMSKTLPELSPLQGENLLRTVIDESPDIILVKNYQGDFLLCNQALARLYGSTPEQMVGKSDADFNPNTEQVEFYKRNIQQVIRSGRQQVVEESSTDSATGEIRYFQSIKKPLAGADGYDRILVIAHDITDLKRAHQLIEEKEKRYAYAMDAAGEGIWDWDIAQKLVRHNAKWCQLLELNSDHYEHDMSVLAQLIHPEDRAAMMLALDKALTTDGRYSSEHRMLRPDGSFIWVYDRGRVVEWDGEGKACRMVGSISDISERKQAEQRLADAKQALERSNEQLELLVAERTSELARANHELELLARHDALTGVGNRLQLESWLAQQPDDLPVAVLMLDIDHFKKINDALGHRVGDSVLRAVALAMKQHVRYHDQVIRFGGEEFVLILSGATTCQALQSANLLRKHIEQLENLPTLNPVTVSIGLATGPCGRFDQLMQRADECLYQAKHQGRNQVVAEPSVQQGTTAANTGVQELNN